MQQDIMQLASAIRQAGHIVVLSGAGMSTESGIPDFRSAKGLWQQGMQLEELVSIDYFRADPEAFWHSFKQLFHTKLLGNYQPNAGHRFLAWLEETGKQVSVLTQNIDGLHGVAGSRHVSELHGTLRMASCPSCGRQQGLEYINHHVLPLCTYCMDVLKPDVVLYGEPVPLIEHAFDVAVSADLLLVLGSSLEVSPVNHIPLEAAHAGVMTALINYTPTRMDRVFDLTIQAGIGDTCQQLRSLLP
ncbi:NAD-dependent protein deacylase [Aquitalea sp. USM4]|uniref:NAD-dependent protein deacylase n=1 Tax=Aquitalea sp. USM4 TaxID=1590041 RepID=UPI00103E1D2E|nr:NAD-dependent protein deacylase [Aquitalea sp. USM4]QBJ77992.1 NAD-dependent protein deacylase [Aquitalea sp. USM4]